MCSWLYRAVVKDGRILTYDSRYFDLGPLEKRLYEIARAHCGKQRGFKMGLEKLRRRVGYGQGPEDLKYFKRDILALAKKSRHCPSTVSCSLTQGTRVALAFWWTQKHRHREDARRYVTGASSSSTLWNLAVSPPMQQSLS